MYLQDFISARNIKQSAASMYLKRHEEEFEGHTELRDGKLWLDETAVALLSKKYPVLPVDDIWTPQAKQAYDAIQEELRDANAEIRMLNKENRAYREFEMKYRALETEYQLKLVAEVDKETGDLKKEIGHLEGFIQDAKREIEVLQKEKIEQKREADQEIEDLRRQLAAETQRREEAEQKTWFQKLIGR